MMVLCYLKFLQEAVAVHLALQIVVHGCPAAVVVGALVHSVLVDYSPAVVLVHRFVVPAHLLAHSVVVVVP